MPTRGDCHTCLAQQPSDSKLRDSFAIVGRQLLQRIDDAQGF